MSLRPLLRWPWRSQWITGPDARAGCAAFDEQRSWFSNQWADAGTA